MQLLLRLLLLLLLAFSSQVILLKHSLFNHGCVEDNDDPLLRSYIQPLIM